MNDEEAAEQSLDVIGGMFSDNVDAEQIARTIMREENVDNLQGFGQITIGRIKRMLVDAARTGYNARRRFDGKPRMEYALFREHGMTMEGPAMVRISAASFSTKEQAKAAVSVLPNQSTILIRRRMVTDWEVVDE